MYVIIKRDKAEHLKEKMHHIKTAAMEVLECIEEAAEKHHERLDDYYRDDARYSDRPVHSDYPEHEDYRRDYARRSRGRY